MESSDLSSGAQKSPEPDFGKKSPEPKRRKLDVLGDDYQPNVYIESEVDGTGNDSGEEDMSTEAYLAYLGACTADRPKVPAPKTRPWEIDYGPETTIDPMVFVGSHCSICGKSDAHPTIFCPYLQFLPEDGKLAPNAPATIVGIMSGEELERGPGRVVLDFSKMRA